LAAVIYGTRYLASAV